MTPTQAKFMNVFLIFGCRRTFVNASGCPVQAFQMFVPGRKVDFLFGAN